MHGQQRLLNGWRLMPAQPLDLLSLPVRMGETAVVSPRTVRPSTVPEMSQRNMWHQQTWGTNDGFQQNASVLAAARAAAKTGPATASTYMPTGICLSTDGTRFVARHADAAAAHLRAHFHSSQRDAATKVGRISVNLHGPQMHARPPAPPPASPGTGFALSPRNTVW